jgi:hypothetical protein
MVAQLAKDVIALHCRVDKTTGPYSKPDEYNPHRSHPTPLRRTWMLSPYLHLNAPTGPSHRVVKLKFCMFHRFTPLCSSMLTEDSIIRSFMVLTPYQPLMVAQWLRHCATNRKVAGSIPDGVTGIFHWRNPSDRTMALGVDSASNRNEYQEHFLGVKATGA